jgi:hypothetical protein
MGQPYLLYAPIVLKSASLKLLEPSGPVEACNGIALPLSLSSSFQISAAVIDCPTGDLILEYSEGALNT